MSETTTKEQILKKIRAALIDKPLNPFKDIDVDSNLLIEFSDDKEVCFAQKFIEEGGKFAYFASRSEAEQFLENLLLQNHWEIDNYSWSKLVELRTPKNMLPKAKVRICDAEALVARNASVVIADNEIQQNTDSFDAFIVFVSMSQVVSDISDGIEVLKKKYEEMPQIASFIRPGESMLTRNIFVLLIEE